MGGWSGIRKAYLGGWLGSVVAVLWRGHGLSMQFGKILSRHKLKRKQEMCQLVKNESEVDQPQQKKPLKSNKICVLFFLNYEKNRIENC